MLMSFNLDSARTALKNGQYSELIGKFENEWLECKGQPYDLGRDDQKLELAKDITGLANADGGLLIIGYSTIRSDTHGDDQIHEIRAFPVDRFSQTQYESVLSNWIYPPIEGLMISKFIVSEEKISIIVCIDVPKVEGPNRPALVAKSILDSNRKVENLMGYFVRKQSHVAHYDVKRIQALFRDGLRYDQDVRDNFSSLLSAIESLKGNINQTFTPITDEDLQSRINKSRSAVELQGLPAIVLTATPSKVIDLSGIFESRSTDLVRLIESPPEVRSFGFNLGTGERSKIQEGKVRRAVDVGFKLIEAHRDGVLIFIGNGGENGLCWGRPHLQSDSRLINQIALVEFVYLFCKLYKSAYASHLKPEDTIKLGIELLDMSMEGKNVRLETGLPGSAISRYFAKPAPSNSLKLSCKTSYSTSAEKSAVLLLQEVYFNFGLEADTIPLTMNTPNDGKVIDSEALTQLT